MKLSIKSLKAACALASRDRTDIDAVYVCEEGLRASDGRAMVEIPYELEEGPEGDTDALGAPIPRGTIQAFISQKSREEKCVEVSYRKVALVPLKKGEERQVQGRGRAALEEGRVEWDVAFQPLDIGAVDWPDPALAKRTAVFSLESMKRLLTALEGVGAKFVKLHLGMGQALVEGRPNPDGHTLATGKICTTDMAGPGA